MPTVERRKVPRFRVLTGIGSAANKRATDVLAQMMRNVRTVLEASPADPKDIELVGATRAEPVQKNLLTEDEKFEKSLAVFTIEQQEKHGAPDPLTVLPATLQTRLLGAIPFTNGMLQPDTALAMRPLNPELKFSERIVPLSIVTHFSLPVKSADLRNVLRGDRKEVVRLIKHPGLDVFTITQGSSTWLAAQMLNLDALKVEVARPSKVIGVGPATGRVFPFEGLISLARRLTSEHVYRVPAALEALAALARDSTRNDFVIHFHHGEHGEEEAARVTSLRLDDQRTSLFTALIRAGTTAGLPLNRAEAEAKKDPKFQRVERLAAAANRIRANVQERHDAIRERLRAAVEEAFELRDTRFAPFDAEVWLRSGRDFWEEANKPLTLNELVDGDAA